MCLWSEVNCNNVGRGYKLKFDKKFEEEILAQALRDVKYLKSAARILDAHHFNTPQHSWCGKIIRGNWNKYKEPDNTKNFI